MKVVLQDGVWREDGRVCLDADDLALARGLGVFETMRSYEGGLPLVDAHLARLSASAAALGLPWPGSALLEDELRRCLVRARSRPGLVPELRLRLGLTPTTRYIVAQALEPAPSSVRAVTRPHPTQPWLSGRVKHISRAGSVLAVREAAVDEVIWVGPQGELLEGTWSNVFAVKGGALLTPSDDGRILAGVTRAQILAQARVLGIPVQEAPFRRPTDVDELYISSSLKLLCPIVELDGVPARGAGLIGQAINAALGAELAKLGRAWAQARAQA